MYCQVCGKEIKDGLENCPYCGAVVVNHSSQQQGVASPQVREKEWVVALLLCFFIGSFGVHRFYVNKNKSGIVMLFLTITVIGAIFSWIWAIYDLIMILLHKFKTADGRDLV